MTKKQKAFYDYLQELKTEEREDTRFVETVSGSAVLWIGKNKRSVSATDINILTMR